MARDYGEQKLIHEMDYRRNETIKFQTVTKDGVVKGDIRKFFVNEDDEERGTREGFRLKDVTALKDFRAGIDMLIMELDGVAGEKPKKKSKKKEE